MSENTYEYIKAIAEARWSLLTYNYRRQGLTTGGWATAGKTYNVLRTKQNLNGMTDGWLASEIITEDCKRLFVREGTDSVAYFGRDDILSMR